MDAELSPSWGKHIPISQVTAHWGVSDGECTWAAARGLSDLYVHPMAVILTVN